MKKFVLLCLVALCAFAGINAPAQGVTSRVPPEGNVLYGLDAFDTPGRLGRMVSASAGTFETVGTVVDHEKLESAAQPAFDPISGEVYWISWFTPTTNYLFKLDLVTGASTYIGLLAPPEGVTGFSPEALAIGTDGILYVTYAGSSKNFVGTVDKATGAVTAVGELLSGIDTITLDSMWGFAFNPVDREFYGVSEGDLYKVNVKTGGLTFLGNNSFNGFWWGIAFDTSGTIWSLGDDAVTSSTIADWTNASATEKGEFYLLDGNDWYSESVFIIYPLLTNDFQTVQKQKAVSFGANVTTLSTFNQKALAAVVKSIPKNATEISISLTRFVNPGTVLPSVSAKSLARLKVVKTFLKAEGLKGTWQQGVKSAASYDRIVVRVSYQIPA